MGLLGKVHIISVKLLIYTVYTDVYWESFVEWKTFLVLGSIISGTLLNTFELLFRSKAQCRSYFRELYQYTQRLYFQTLLVVLYFSTEKAFILVYIEIIILLDTTKILKQPKLRKYNNKNPSCRRHQLSLCVRIVAPMLWKPPFWYFS